MKLQVLYEDNHLLIVNKPAGIATQGATPDQSSLWTIARDYIKSKYHKPGNVYLGVVSRLDLVATGVLAFARTSKAANRLNEQFSKRKVAKTYLAIVEGGVGQPGSFRDWIYKDDDARRMRVSNRPLEGGKLAELDYRIAGTIGDDTILEVDLKTGRKHQIRVQFSSHGNPIVGDRKYGSRISFPVGIALHAIRLELRHPIKQTVMTFTAPLPEYWPR